jgi:hypothetical protein
VQPLPTQTRVHPWLLSHLTLSHVRSPPAQLRQSGPAPALISAASQVSGPPTQSTLHEVALAQSIFFGEHELVSLHLTMHGRPGGHVISPAHFGPGQSISHAPFVHRLQEAGHVPSGGEKVLVLSLLASLAPGVAGPASAAISVPNGVHPASRAAPRSTIPRPGASQLFAGRIPSKS